MATSNVIKLKVHFELNTPNGLRRVIFGLEKDATSGTTVVWTINFQLFERARKTLASSFELSSSASRIALTEKWI